MSRLRCLNQQNVRHPRIFADINLDPAAQCSLAGRHLTHGSLLVDASIYGLHTGGDEAAAIQPRPFTAYHVVGMEVAERYATKKFASQWRRIRN